MKASASTGVTFEKRTQQPVGRQKTRKPVKIKDVYNERIEAMRSLNEELAANVTFFSFFESATLSDYKMRAKELVFDLWFHGDKEAIQRYLSKHVGGPYFSLKKAKREKIIEFISEFITDRNGIYFAPVFDQYQVGTALIRGNLTQDFLFTFIEKHLKTSEAFLFKKHIRSLFRAISIIQYSLIQQERSQSGFIAKLSKKKARFFDPEKILDHFNEGSFSKSVLKLVHKKLGKESVRSSFARWTFEHLEAQPDQDVNPQVKDFLSRDLPLLIEIAISIMYYDNQVLDSKGNVKKLIKVKENLVARTFLKDWCFEYAESRLANEVHQELVQTYLRKIFSSVDVGQHLDKSWNTFQVFETNHFFYNGLSEKLFRNLWPDPDHIAWPFVKEWIKKAQFWIDYKPFLNVFEGIRKENWTKSHYLNLYLDRIFLTNSSLFKSIVELNAELIRYAGKEKEKLLVFATGYGMGLQIVNDCADFIPIPWHYARDNKTVEKKASDVYKDLLNNTMSLPLVIHLARNDKDSIIYRLIKTKPKKITRLQRFRLQKELFHSTTLQDCVLISQKLVRIFNKQEEFRLDRNCEASMFLRDLPSICFYNRYNTERNIIEANFETLEMVIDRFWDFGYELENKVEALRISASLLMKKIGRETTLVPAKISNAYVHANLLRKKMIETTVIKAIRVGFKLLSKIQNALTLIYRLSKGIPADIGAGLYSIFQKIELPWKTDRPNTI